MNSSTAFGPLHQVDAGVLNVGYVDAGPADGPVVLLLHGWPYDIHSYADVVPLLSAAGYRTIVPHLRATAPPGSCRMRRPGTARSRRWPSTPSRSWMRWTSIGRSWPGSIGEPGRLTSSRPFGRNGAPARSGSTTPQRKGLANLEQDRGPGRKRVRSSHVSGTRKVRL
jgi:alpha-beta hydrolase superfamily lysophospholipase